MKDYEVNYVHTESKTAPEIDQPLLGVIENISIIAPPDWTPCAEGMPTHSARYKVTLQVGSEAGTWLETAIIPYRYCDGTGEWILPKSDWMIYGVIAWTKADEPYRADDTTGKVKDDEFMREAMYDQLHSNGN